MIDTSKEKLSVLFKDEDALVSASIVLCAPAFVNEAGRRTTRIGGRLSTHSPCFVIYWMCKRHFWKVHARRKNDGTVWKEG